MKINIGAGDTVETDYIRIDYDTLTNPDYVLDLEKDRLPFEDSTVEAVKAHHILEHLGEGFFHCLQELYRVCKHGARVHIRVPHPRHDTFLADPTHRRPITVMTMQMFSKKFNELCRQQNAATSRLADYFNVDFEIIDYKYIPDRGMEATIQHLNSQQKSEYADQHFNIVSEIQMTLVVVKHEQ